MPNTKKILKGVTYCSDSYSMAKGCDCLLLITEWDEFKDLDFSKIGRSMKQPILFDGRNLYKQEDIEKFGFEYYGIGRGNL